MWVVIKRAHHNSSVVTFKQWNDDLISIIILLFFDVLHFIFLNIYRLHIDISDCFSIKTRKETRIDKISPKMIVGILFNKKNHLLNMASKNVIKTVTNKLNYYTGHFFAL